MARRETAARRYAEAAFEVAQRDDSVAAWRAELDAASSIVADERVGRMLANPAVALETRTEMADSVLGKVVGQPVLNLIGLMLRRSRIDQLPRVAAEFRGPFVHRVQPYSHVVGGWQTDAIIADFKLERGIPFCQRDASTRRRKLSIPPITPTPFVDIPFGRVLESAGKSRIFRNF
jgi:hypothetical protein